MKLYQPYFFSELGKRTNQEDSFYPINPSDNDNLFIVCDGMGGYEYGEIASKVVCESIASFFRNVKKEDISVQMINRALCFAYDELNIKDEESEHKGIMGTTLALLYFSFDKVYIAHIGDSRVYQIRIIGGQPGIVHKTFDHSLVNELLRDRIITEQEAASHPNKNIITRAIQPAPAKRYEADVSVVNDILVGDYFFLCTDGVIESLTDNELVKILSEDISDSDKINKIREICSIGSKDNNTAYLIHVKNIEEHINIEQKFVDCNKGKDVKIRQIPRKCNKIIRRESPSISNRNKIEKDLLWQLIIGFILLTIILFLLKYNL